MDEAKTVGEAVARRTASTYDRIAAEYAASTAVPSEALATLRSQVFDRVGPGGKILDLGCGPGRDVSWFNQKGAYAVGLDRSVSMLELFSHRLPAVCADMTALPLASGSLDGVWSAASLLHVRIADLDRTLSEWRRVLRIGGHGALTTSTGGGEGLEDVPYDPTSGPRSSRRLDRWFAHHDENDLQATLVSVGFAVEHKSYRQGYRMWIDILFCRIR